MLPFPPPCFFWHLEKREALGRADVWGIPQWKACFAMETFPFISKPQSLDDPDWSSQEAPSPIPWDQTKLKCLGQHSASRLCPFLHSHPVCLPAPSHSFSPCPFPAEPCGSLFLFCHILRDLLSCAAFTVKDRDLVTPR